MLTFGVETRDITPIEPVPLAGYGYNLPNNRMSTEVAGRLAASVLVVDDGETRAALCGVDLLSVDLYTASAVQEIVSTHDKRPTTVLINASHNHSGPATRALYGAGGYNWAYVERTLVPALSNTILAASSNTQPGAIGIARAHAYGLNFNRTGGKSLDDRITAIRVDRDDGSSIAGAHFACHPTVLGPKSTLISPDYPGFARDALAEDTGVESTLWHTGCAGDINPEVRRAPGCQRSLAEARTVGAAIGHIAADLYQGAQLHEGKVHTHSTIVDLPLDADFVLKPEIELEAFCEARHIPSGQDVSAVRKWLHEMAPIINHSSAETIPVPVTIIAIGKLTLVGFGAEIYNSTGLKIEEAFPDLDVVTMMTSNGHQGYIPIEDDYNGKGYAPRTSPIAFGRRPLIRNSEEILRLAAIDAVRNSISQA